MVAFLPQPQTAAQSFCNSAVRRLTNGKGPSVCAHTWVCVCETEWWLGLGGTPTVAFKGNTQPHRAPKWAANQGSVEKGLQHSPAKLKQRPVISFRPLPKLNISETRTRHAWT